MCKIFCFACICTRTTETRRFVIIRFFFAVYYSALIYKYIRISFSILEWMMEKNCIKEFYIFFFLFVLFSGSCSLTADDNFFFTFIVIIPFMIIMIIFVYVIVLSHLMNTLKYQSKTVFISTKNIPHQV